MRNTFAVESFNKMKSFFLFSALFAASLSMTVDQYAIVKTVLDDYFELNATFVPFAVRLAFHDCVGGVCDGCINLDNDSNNGLADVIIKLEELRGDAIAAGVPADNITRADFWSAAAIAAVDRGIKVANKACDKRTAPFCNVPPFNASFFAGRQDCSSAPYTDIILDFPNPTMDAADVFTFFDTWFSFSKRQVVALMGAHTLGSAKRANSGYAGVWVDGEAREFDNRFYTIMTDDAVTWTNVDLVQAPISKNPDRKWEWKGTWSDGSPAGMMLNTDFEMRFDLALNATTAQSGCQVNSDCADAETASIVTEFANDQTLWMNEFREVFQAMMAVGSNVTEVV